MSFHFIETLIRLWRSRSRSAPKTDPQPVFIRRDDSGYLWRTRDCYICFRSFESIPRAFPFECDHEICFRCLADYVHYRSKRRLGTPICGLCCAGMREEWMTPSCVYARQISGTELVCCLATKVDEPTERYRTFARVVGGGGGGATDVGELHTERDRMRCDSLQYQIVYGVHPIVRDTIPRNRGPGIRRRAVTM